MYIEEAIEIIKYFKEHGFPMLFIRYGGRHEANLKIETAIDTISNELEKKDKVINEMSIYVNSPLRIPEEKYCEFYNSDEDCCWKTDKECKDCIKEYFTNKVEREGK